MSLLNEQDRQHLTQEFAGLQHPAKLVVFTSRSNANSAAKPGKLPKNSPV